MNGWTDRWTDGRHAPYHYTTDFCRAYKNLWRSPGSVWFTNCMHSKCLFRVRKVCHTNYCGMVSSVQVEMYHTSWRFSHCYCKWNCTISLKKQPRPLADARINSSGLHRLHSQYHVCWCSVDFRSRASAVMLLIPKARIFLLQHQKS